MRCWVSALVDCPGAQGFYTYEVPADIQVAVGDILSVPFGSQQVGAIAISLETDALKLDLEGVDPSKIRLVDGVICSGFFPLNYWNLLSQVACYYQTSLMQVVRVALPPGLLSRSQRRLKRRDLTLGLLSSVTLSPTAQKVFDLLSESKTGNYSWRFVQQKIRGVNAAVQELTKLGLVESYLQPPETVRPKQQRLVTWVAEVEADGNDRHREIVDVLRRMGGEAWVSELLQVAKTGSTVLKTLEKKGYVTIQMREMLRQEGHSVPSDRPKTLTPEQLQALDHIQKVQGKSIQILLHGVTGSGKTEVYLQAIAPLLDRGKSALVLVPEIGLTPQLTDRFRARFGDRRVRVYHSALSEGERYDTWRQMFSGEAQVVIGTRSAIFAPLSNLGLIILDEEHDSSFKQDQPSPCYHARTVAQWRSHLESCPLLLGSATPSLESWQACAEVPTQEAQYVALPRRVADRPHPKIQVVDMRQELVNGNRSIFSEPLRDALTNLKQLGQQGILFIHRRGHSTHVSCRSCGYVMECPNCDVSLSYHQVHASATELLRCHYCGYSQRQPKVCPVCNSIYFKQFGSGTQRVMQELEREFPGLRSLRFDSDTTRTKGAHRSLLEQFSRGEADLLVGTQMLTKGLDLPQVTLVGIVAADGLLNLQDFRSAERACQTLLQVAGRSGRGSEPGQVILQTYTPDHPVIASVISQDYAAFARGELETRRVLSYPPVGQLVLIRLSSPDAIAVQTAATTVATMLREWARTQASGYEILGPSEASVLRVAQRYRWQVMVKRSISTGWSSTIVELQLDQLRSSIGSNVSLTLDIDPLNFM